jgi:hypothetical protein
MTGWALVTLPYLLTPLFFFFELAISSCIASLPSSFLEVLAFYDIERPSRTERQMKRNETTITIWGESLISCMSDGIFCQRDLAPITLPASREPAATSAFEVTHTSDIGAN